MRCADVQSCFPQLSLPLPGELPVELQAAGEHLEECDECRLTWEAEVASDAKLAQQMRSVAVPADYRVKLHQRLALNRMATEPMHRPARRRDWPWIAAALMLLVGVGAWRLSTATAAVDLARLLEAIDQPITSNVTTARRERPNGWPADSSLVESSPQGVRKLNVPICAVSFQYRALHSTTAASGTLRIVDADRIAQASSIPNFEAAEIIYRPHNSQLIWKEGAVVYILEMEDLRPLKTRLEKSRSLA